MNKTAIEWVKNPDGTQGYSWNPITGCLNGCSYCYARKLANSRVKTSYLANSNLPCHDEPDHQAHHANPFYPRLWENKLTGNKNNPISRKRTIGVFVCNMGDLFGIGVPEDWTRRVLEHIERSPQHRFYLLTKQPQELAKWSPFPDNCWVGVSVTDMVQWIGALHAFDAIEARVKFVSFEPLLERIIFKGQDATDILSRVNWVIIGAQSKPYIAPKVKWVKEIAEAAHAAGIPVFMKDSISTPSFGAEPGLMWRREMP